MNTGAEVVMVIVISAMTFLIGLALGSKTTDDKWERLMVEKGIGEMVPVESTETKFKFK